MLNLLELSADAVDIGWEMLAQIARPLTIKRLAAYDYDFNTGVNIPVYYTDNVQGLVLNYKSSQITGTLLQAGDEKILLRASDLFGIISEGDLVINGSIICQILQARRDPGQSLWILDVRREANVIPVNYGNLATEDRGDLVAFTEYEDWGDFAFRTETLDWRLLAG